QPLIEEPYEGGGESAADFTIAADEPGCLHHFRSELGIQRRAVQHRFTPAGDERPFPLETQRAGAEPAQPAQEPDAEKAEHTGGADMLAARGPAMGPAPLGPAGEGPADRRGQDAVDLVEFGLEI